MPLYNYGNFPTLTTSGNASVGGDVAITGSITVAGNAMGIPTARNHNLVAWSQDPTSNANTTTLTGGTVYLTKLHIPRSVNITKLYWWMGTAGATPTAGQNFGGLYSSSGTRLAVADADATVAATTGLQTLTLPSTALTAGTFVWGALVFNASTIPTLSRGSGTTGAGTGTNVGLTAATYRYATNGTGQTSLPASITPASNVATSFAGPWMAIGE